MQSRRRYGIVLLGTGLVIGFLIARAGIEIESPVEAAGGSGGACRFIAGQADHTNFGVLLSPTGAIRSIASGEATRMAVRVHPAH